MDSAVEKKGSKAVAESSLEGLGLTSESSAEEGPNTVGQGVSVKVCIVDYRLCPNSYLELR